MTERIVERSSRALEARTSRRGLLSRIALGATAFSVAPVRYMTRPISAWAAIKPGDCRGRLCSDGYTEFCCTINRGKNLCPPNTFIGGWWKCTRYKGSRLCGDQNVRYYLDCNVEPGEDHSGCHCAKDRCSNRATNCNVFRYGQCNTQIGKTTPITCRLVTCVNPSKIPGFRCNDTYLTDNNTCRHDTGCLEHGNAAIFGPNPGV